MVGYSYGLYEYTYLLDKYIFPLILGADKTKLRNHKLVRTAELVCLPILITGIRGKADEIDVLEKAFYHLKFDDITFMTFVRIDEFMHKYDDIYAVYKQEYSLERHLKSAKEANSDSVLETRELARVAVLKKLLKGIDFEVVHSFYYMIKNYETMLSKYYSTTNSKFLLSHPSVDRLFKNYMYRNVLRACERQYNDFKKEYLTPPTSNVAYWKQCYKKELKKHLENVKQMI